LSEPAQPDPRKAIYTDLHSNQLSSEEKRNEISSRIILSILFRYLKPLSVLDVGCGLGTWLKIASEMGVPEIYGIDGPWLDSTQIRIPAHMAEKRDLETPFDLGRRFDLTICLEVAEHLFEKSAAEFVGTLTRHAPVVLFSAAIPGQGGHHHVNERFLPYWAELFRHRRYRPLDIIRSEIWDYPEVHWWLRQNTVLFVHEDMIAANDKFRDAFAKPRGPLSLVHPEVYSRFVDSSNGLLRIIGQGGTFEITPQPNGTLQITRVKESAAGVAADANAAPPATNSRGIGW
jgi:SAM-dependent methyltransferase